jgi:hypothetical protein
METEGLDEPPREKVALGDAFLATQDLLAKSVV